VPTPFFLVRPLLCPPPARLTRLPPPHTHLPPILPTPCTRARCALPLCTPPVTVTAQCSHCTLLSLHLAITSSGLPANFPTLQVSDFPTSRKADKSKSQQIGKLASVPPPGSTARPSSHHQPPRTGEPPAYRSSSSHPAGKPHPPARSPPYPPGRPNKRGLPRLTPSKMYNAIVSGRCPAQTALVAQATKEVVHSLQRQHVAQEH
jgi:hypothetical protein